MMSADRITRLKAPLQIRRRVPHLVVFAIVAAFYLGGGLEFLEHRLMDLRFLASQRDATSDLVLVDVDTASLRELGVWPWPRTYHASVLEKVLAGGARRVALEVEFSSRSQPEADRALEQALAKGAGKIILPIFKQRDPSAGSEDKVVLTVPIPQFARHGQPAFVNVWPESDSLIRRMPVEDTWRGRTFPSLAAALAEVSDATLGAFYIDFGIRPASIPRLSFADVLRDRVDATAFAGKRVIIGATAIELGDQLAVPLYLATAGPLVQALAYESLVQGRALQRIALTPVLLVALVLALFVGPHLASRPWRLGLGLLAAVWGASLVLAFATQALAPVIVDVTPWLLGSLLSYLFGLTSALDRQTLRVVHATMTATHRKAAMQHILDNSFDGIVMVDAGGAIDMFNPVAERIFGHSSFEARGQKASVLFTPTFEGEGDEGSRIGRALESGDSELTLGGLREVTGRRKDGSTFPMEIIVTSLEPPTAVGGSQGPADDLSTFTCTVRDITQRKHAEENARLELERRVEERTAELRAAQEQIVRSERLATLGQLTATVSHELRNPLGTMRASMFVINNIVKQATEDNRVGRALDRIERSITRCDRIIDELLDFTRTRELDLQPTVIDDWLDELLDDQIVPEGIELQRNLGCPNTVLSFDRDSFRRAIINVYENACQALAEERSRDPNAELRIAVDTEMSDEHVEISVTDTGPGIRPEVMPTIFEPLYSTKGFGVGLGLTVVKRVLEQHGGGVKITSDLWSGTRFKLWLPLSRPEERVSA